MRVPHAGESVEAWSVAREPLRCGSGVAVPHRPQVVDAVEQDLDEFGVEVAAGLLADDVEDLRLRPRLLVAAPRGQGVEDVGEADDAGEERNGLAAEALRGIARTVGLPWSHGLPRPDHRLFETHPIINSELLEEIDAGAIRPVGDVVAFDGSEVVFHDGRRETVDVVICATGYRPTLPFIDCRLLGAAAADGVPSLFMNLLHPTRDDIAVVGLIQPDSGQWGITDVQAKLVARMALAARIAPRAAGWLYARRQRPARPNPIRYVDSPRHTLEVEHFSYRRELERIVTALEARLRRERPAAASAAG